MIGARVGGGGARVGDSMGLEEVGETEGDSVGREVVGVLVGDSVGL